ncbi:MULTISPECIES: hypothetical protein [Dyella]|uniref:Uncharacterized protein n=2 Tax=Dyella TaxID=231454 RepID=A0A4R0YTL9_9GAMM|nr:MULTISPECIES: hypothetical protein [Dyella]TBR39838.1 hypothetical protein EYV96_06545 [Dyella terrae]TCI12582.1 hypothetical protein EZM97_04325 [Dyella soli]
MPMIRIRLIGSREQADTVINALHGIDGIEHVEEVDDLMQDMRDDSSSSDLVDDEGGGLFRIEVQASDQRHAGAVRDVVEYEAFNLGAVAEFVEEF